MSQSSDQNAKASLTANALLYHSLPRPGKIEVVSTKPLVTQEDLSLGYTPGVAEVCREIHKNPEQASHLTSRSNLVAVATNGSAVLGLGNIGPLASKPVMEGKSVLFKKFANIDVFDLEINETDVDAFVDTMARLEPTFGGINLEDIKAPQCFEIEEKLKKRVNIPVLHDDQHGTAIIVLAAFINGIHIAGKTPEEVNICCVGAGAAGLACMNLLVAYGVPRENVTLVDLDGVVYKDREQMNPYLEVFAKETDMRTLDDAIDGADVFFGLSAGGVLKPELIQKMAENPIIFAMANPDPEILPNEAKAVRPDVIIGTGRSDFPNQINNVLGFPYLFRGALDCGACEFNTEMKIAAAQALADLARKEADASLAAAYKGARLKFGRDYLIPKPFDARLLSTIASAVAQAAQETGVAARPIEDMAAYRAQLHSSIDQSFAIMRQMFATARKHQQRIVYPEGEDGRILQAAQSVVNEGIAHPIILGRENVVLELLDEYGLSIRPGTDFTLVDPQTDDRIGAYTHDYYQLRKREGVTPEEAGVHLRGRWMVFGCMMLKNGDADGLVAGVSGRFQRYYSVARQVLMSQKKEQSVYALQLVTQKDKTLFMADTHINPNPSAAELAELTQLAAQQVTRFGLEPRVALLSHSNFGSHSTAEARKMQEALKLIRQQQPDLQIDGEMQADTALSTDILHRIFPDANLHEAANLLVMPNLDAANIAFNLLRMTAGETEYIGPMLLNMPKPVHILSVESPVRRIVNMTALAAVEASSK